MYTQAFLNQIKEAIYHPYFIEGILELHADRVEAGEYHTQIRDYQKGVEATLPTFSEEEKAKFEEYESICKTIREEHAKHGFMAGIYAGFRHIFTPFKEIDAGYDKYVVNEVMMMENLPRNQKLYQAVLKRNEIYGELAKGRVKDSYSPMVSISCYWDEMFSSAGALAFYMGYRAAHTITDRFGLMETDYAARTAKLLMLEHAFGYIETVAERDRRLERQANGTWDAEPDTEDDSELPNEE